MIDLIAINHHGIAVRLSFMHASQETMLVAVDPNNRRQDATAYILLIALVQYFLQRTSGA